MERKLLLVFALTFLVIMLFQPLLRKYLPQPPAQPAQNAPVQQAQPSQASAAPESMTAPATTATKQATAETETVIENGVYRIVFTNRGAQVKSWILKKYTDDFGKPLDLVNQGPSAKFGYPLSLWAYDPNLRNKLNSVLYVASASGQIATPAELTFEYSDGDVAVRKTFRFDESYVLTALTSVTEKGSQVPAFPMWPTAFGDQEERSAFSYSDIEYHNDQSSNRSLGVIPKTTERISYKSVSGGGTFPGPFNWAGVSDQYFAAAFLPDSPDDAALVTLRNSIDIPKDEHNPKETSKIDALGAAVGNMHGETSERIFVGPKTLSVLETIPIAAESGAHDLRDLVNFGFFGSIARPLFLWLKWTRDHWIHNWGWAIVIQTAIITIALLPLQISQMKSALKMQKVAPQAKAIQEKYKKYSMRDPRKQDMQKEISELYKKEGVNPIGGCLPMLIQVPFLWAYYQMLRVAIDLRHAPWLWIGDLSSRDPYFILPILMVVSMIFTQRMSPQPGIDPAQQKMMNWTMPLMMGFLFFNFAAGLNLYYAESNLIRIVQQAVMNRTSLGRELRELALKRARKKNK
jgi:YidC/Oxa1 family membrane protein insertase